jgi:RimJ/RimL family protein N-acetyltransferase
MINKKVRAIKLEGKRIFLSPILRKDVPSFQKWVNNLEITMYTAQATNIFTIEDEYEWFEKTRKSKDTIVLSIVKRNSNEVIGAVSLNEINYTDRRANLGIMIGEIKEWNKGYGKEALVLILDFGFNVLNLHNIYLSVYSYNKRAIMAYNKLGFKLTGKLRKARFLGGEYYDILIMDMLAKEFKESKIKCMVR